MGLQAIGLQAMRLQATEASPRNGNPTYLLDQDSSDMTTAHRAMRQDISFQREGTSIAFSSPIARRNPKRRAHAEQAEALRVHPLPRERVFCGLASELSASRRPAEDTKQWIETLNWRSARNSHHQRQSAGGWRCSCRS